MKLVYDLIEILHDKYIGNSVKENVNELPSGKMATSSVHVIGTWVGYESFEKNVLWYFNGACTSASYLASLQLFGQAVRLCVVPSTRNKILEFFGEILTEAISEMAHRGLAYPDLWAVIDEFIECFESQTSTAGTNWLHTSYLAGALFTRFQNGASLNDLDRAIALAQRSTFQTFNEGIYLEARWESTGSSTDLVNSTGKIESERA